jgi:hypothetical protein
MWGINNYLGGLSVLLAQYTWVKVPTSMANLLIGFQRVGWRSGINRLRQRLRRSPDESFWLCLPTVEASCAAKGYL